MNRAKFLSVLIRRMEILDSLIVDVQRKDNKASFNEMEKVALNYAIGLVIADIEANGGIDANTKNLVTTYLLNCADRKSHLPSEDNAYRYNHYEFPKPEAKK